MKKASKIIYATLISFIVLISSSVIVAYHYSSGTISNSHLVANVPKQENFDEYLQRDLDIYFTELKDTSVQVEYKLLRNEPTQVGLAFPKYYAWVDIQTEDGYSESGAAYIAAISGEYFQIISYMDAEEITQDTDALYKMYPEDICNQIIERLNE